jgi:hypothetical protein
VRKRGRERERERKRERERDDQLLLEAVEALGSVVSGLGLGLDLEHVRVKFITL